MNRGVTKHEMEQWGHAVERRVLGVGECSRLVCAVWMAEKAPRFEPCAAAVMPSVIFIRAALTRRKKGCATSLSGTGKCRQALRDLRELG